MKREELLDAIGQVSSEFVEAADAPVLTRVNARKKKMAVAAAIAAAFLLAGCTAVAAVVLENRKISETTEARNYDDYGSPVTPGEIPINIASLFGSDGDPAQQAAKEWYEYTASFAEAPPMEDGVEEVLAKAYGCRNADMVKKLQAIAKKYDLKLPQSYLELTVDPEVELALKELDVDLFRDKDSAQGTSMDLYAPQDFVTNVNVTLKAEDAPWKEQVFAKYYYMGSGYLAPSATFAYDPAEAIEWEYTVEGQKLRLVLDGGSGLILSQQKDATVAVTIDFLLGKTFLETGEKMPTQKALEAMAECFRYDISPREPDMEALKTALDTYRAQALAKDEAADRANTLGAFADMVNFYYWPETVDYAMYDMDGDGSDELLLSYGDGYICDAFSLQNGEVLRPLSYTSVLLCEDNYFIESSPDSPGKAIYRYENQWENQSLIQKCLESYYPSDASSTGWMRYDCEGETTEESSRQAALDAAAKYTPVKLQWKPLTDFPMDEKGTTFGEILKAEGTPTEEELIAYYAEHLPTDQPYQSFELRDINADGTLDLLLSCDGETISSALTLRRGQLRNIGGPWEFYLCEGNVREEFGSVGDQNTGKLEQHSYYRILGDRPLPIGMLQKNVGTGQWQYNQEPIDEAEAQAILAKYPRVQLNLRPISELGK